MKNFIDITHKNLAVKLAETREEIEKARVLRFDELINKSNPDIPYSQCFDDSDFYLRPPYRYRQGQRFGSGHLPFGQARAA